MSRTVAIGIQQFNEIIEPKNPERDNAVISGEHILSYGFAFDGKTVLIDMEHDDNETGN